MSKEDLRHQHDPAPSSKKDTEPDKDSSSEDRKAEFTAASYEELLSEKNNPSPDAQGSDNLSEAEQLRRDLEEATDKTLRARAELENFRKRMQRLMEEERKYASMELFRDLLPVWDNMGRALEAVDKTDDNASLYEGLNMMHRQLLEVLEKHECRRIESIHQPFDPNFHESIAQQPNAELPPGTVIFETQVGFQLHDRVVRPSQVVLAAADPEAQLEEQNED